MNLQKLIFVNNACFKAGRYITPKGLFVHSTGANNPCLKRYVGPDDGLLGKNTYGNHWNRPMDRQVCCHAFIGKLEDGSIATYQTLPWDMRGWHSGSGPKGNANDYYCGFEICEDGLTNETYFRGVFNEAVELCAYLCDMFGFDPMKDGVIIGHYEAYQRGIASNHADPQHWFKRFGESMNSFRAAVKSTLASHPSALAPISPPEPSTLQPATPAPATPEPAPSAPANPEHEVYTVVKGDSLWRIAAAMLGAGVRYLEIKAVNSLSSDTIYVGQKLKIPAK
jgi:LysM repeat protein